MNFLASTIIKCEESEELDLYEEVSKLANEIGWDNTIKEAYRTLCSLRVVSLWYGAACIIYFAIQDKRSIPFQANDLIARLYWCLDKKPNLGCDECGENLVWSIVCSVKGIPYTSYWEPLKDEEILALMAKINGG